MVAAIDPSTGLPFWRIPDRRNPLPDPPGGCHDAADPAPRHADRRALGRAITPGSAYWEYPEDIQVYGISAATNIASWSVSFEVSRHIGVPVQVNGNDLLQSLLGFVGPNAAEGVAAALQGDGGYARGYDRFNKTRTRSIRSRTQQSAGRGDFLIVARSATRNRRPGYLDGADEGGRVNVRRGLEPSLRAVAGTVAIPARRRWSVHRSDPRPGVTPTKRCLNDGYVTTIPGVARTASADYNNVFDSGITVTPSVFWADDVDGVSMDPTFIEGRQVLGLGLRFNLNKRYNLEMNYVDYADADFDPLFDRDYYSVSASVTF